ncbi:hypothetical protein KIPB_016587, partial [Kipferlia bialata]
RYIDKVGKCPATGEALSTSDIMDVQLPVRPSPRSPGLGSVPQLIQAVMTEYDASMLELARVRQGSASLKGDLAKALYQLDASYKKVAVVEQERDEAR